jgi:membrane-bound metal-dependent hydrolase YbcI (DUF457 family)
MPVTPFHFGPGLVLKAVGRHYFSFSVFCLVQVVIDTEVMAATLSGTYPLHRTLHTYLGATGVALLCIVFGRPLCIWAKRAWNRHLDAKLKTWLWLPEPISLFAAVTGAFLGAYSHVFLDSFLHADMHPFAPFSNRSPLYGEISYPLMHLLCFLLGVLGALWLAFQRRRAYMLQ